MGETPDMVRRRDATQRTFDAFMDEPFTWEGSTCIHLAVFHARAMGWDMPNVPEFHGAAGARMALKKMGVRSVKGLLNSFFAPIAPAYALVGDLLALPGEKGLEGVCVVLGNGRCLGWLSGYEGATVLEPLIYRGGWRL
jgi:hypothetical protein